MTRRLPWMISAGALLLLLTAGFRPVQGQVQIRNLVFTSGTALEGYRGNLTSVTIPVVDSTEAVGAVVAQLSGTTDIRFVGTGSHLLDLHADLGVRQFGTWGWTGRDYAPREWVSTAELSYAHSATWGLFSADVTGRGRWVHDRPPSPLYIEPGYGRVVGRLAYATPTYRDVRFDGTLFVEYADYAPEPAAPQLDLLDRESLGFEVGAAWGDEWGVRVFTGYQVYEYAKQSTFDPADPFRRDRAVRGGFEWTSQESDYFLQLRAEGVLNRSNSARPEYNAVTVRGIFATPLPGGVMMNAYVQLTDKNYLTDTGFAQVVPGEEADNSSVIFVEANRQLATNLSGAFRVGWTRAESNIADEYFERFSGTFLLTFRPDWLR